MGCGSCLQFLSSRRDARQLLGMLRLQARRSCMYVSLFRGILARRISRSRNIAPLTSRLSAHSSIRCRKFSRRVACVCCRSTRHNLISSRPPFCTPLTCLTDFSPATLVLFQIPPAAVSDARLTDAHLGGGTTLWEAPTRRAESGYCVLT